MIVNITDALEKGRKGLSIWRIETGFQVSVKGADGAFTVGYGDTAQSALDDALGIRPPVLDDDDLL